MFWLLNVTGSVCLRRIACDPHRSNNAATPAPAIWIKLSMCSIFGIIGVLIQ